MNQRPQVFTFNSCCFLLPLKLTLQRNTVLWRPPFEYYYYFPSLQENEMLLIFSFPSRHFGAGPFFGSSDALRRLLDEHDPLHLLLRDPRVHPGHHAANAALRRLRGSPRQARLGLGSQDQHRPSWFPSSKI